MAGAAGALLAAEVCAPLLLGCWLLCCWPDDASDRDDASSSGKHPEKPVVSHDWSRRRGSSSRGSAASLHLPGPSGMTSHTPRALRLDVTHRGFSAGSGQRVPLSARRSHEELPGRRSHEEPAGGRRSHEDMAGRGVLEEVLGRRVWRSARDLTLEAASPPAAAPPPPPPPPRCKKHHSNTKRSRRDVTETAGDVTPRFYIGPAAEPASVLSDVIHQLQRKEEAIRCLYRAKEGKQWVNESLRGACADPPASPRAITRAITRAGSRSGARTPSLPDEYPPASVEPAPCRARCLQPAQPPPPPAGRHASDGDILATAAPRPESGAFSESDVELSLRAVPIPAPRTSPAHVPRETAI